MSRRPEARAGVEGVDLTELTALVTGATDGIGRETALALGRLGADVLVHGRDQRKGRAVVSSIESTGANATFLPAEFADLDAVRDLAGRARDRGVDILVNNAGLYSDERRTTGAGVELTLAVNHLAPFVLTLSVLDTIEAANGRVVTVASGAHRGVELDLAAMCDPEEYDGFLAYRRSKLANVLFSAELSRRTPVPANSLHPGFVPGSALWRNAPWYVRAATGALSALPERLADLFVTTVRGAAATPVYLAASPDLEASGRYFRACEPRRPSEAARDGDAARRLWEASVEWAGLEPAAVPDRR